MLSVNDGNRLIRSHHTGCLRWPVTPREARRPWCKLLPVSPISRRAAAESPSQLHLIRTPNRLHFNKPCNLKRWRFLSIRNYWWWRLTRMFTGLVHPCLMWNCRWLLVGDTAAVHLHGCFRWEWVRLVQLVLSRTLTPVYKKEQCEHLASWKCEQSSGD